MQNNNKDIVSNDGQFKIATENIIMVENEYGSSYSFNVINQLDTNHTFENFVVTVNNNGRLEYRIIGFTSQENIQDNSTYTIESLIVDNNFIDIEQFFTQKEYLYDWVGSCLYMWENSYDFGWPDSAILIICVGGGSGSGSGNDSATGADGYTGPSGTNTGMEGGYGNPDSYTGGTGSSSSSSASTPIAVNPPRYTETVSNALFNADYLTPAIQEWLNNADYLTLKKLATFLTDHNNSSEAVSFVLEAIETLNNGGEVDFPNKVIIDSTLINNERLNCVYNKFKNGTNTISSYLNNFLGENPVGHLKIVSDDYFQTNFPNSGSSGAITHTPQNFIIQITFNSDPFSNAGEPNMPTIILGLEFFHEMVHAEMYRKLLAYAQQPSITWTEEFINSLRNDFPGLADYYTRYWLNLPENQQPTDAQHELMAQHYINILKDALKDFDDNQHNEDFYTALAWTGLRNTVAWNNLSPVLQSNYINTLNYIIQNETHNCN